MNKYLYLVWLTCFQALRTLLGALRYIEGVSALTFPVIFERHTRREFQKRLKIGKESGKNGNER